MITCREARELGSRRLDGELSGEGVRALDAHLEACAACRDLAQRDADVSSRLRRALAVPRAELEALEERALAAASSGGSVVEARERFGAGRGWRLRVAAFAASALLGFGAFLASPLFRGEQPAHFAQPEITTPRAASGDPAAPRAVICLEGETEEAGLVPRIDGPPLEVRRQRARSILTDVPRGPRDGELFLELERVEEAPRRPVTPPGTWY